MNPLDVRDVQGRLTRLLYSVLIGVVGAVAIASALPQVSLEGWGVGAFGLANPVLVGAGALGITLVMSSFLAALARRAVHVHVDLPRAEIVRR